MNLQSYFKNIWKLRYFWTHLALSDLRSRWRRSFFGILWSIIQPLGMALLLSFIFSRLLNSNVKHFIPYILSGIIVWEFIISAVTNGSTSFIQATSYIKQCKHPLSIYTLRTVLNALIVLMLASIPLFLLVLVLIPQNFNISWIATFTIYPILILLFWPIATYLAYIGTRFHDLIPALTLIMQALWFISPVSFEVNMFRAGDLNWLIDYNPIYHLLQIIRAPLLDGVFPTIENYFFCLLTIIIVTTMTVIIGLKSENRIIYYL
ncbi:MAG: ABC transporter permease [Rickettsiales endosymbiont of Dermacentor nuttalli]